MVKLEALVMGGLKETLLGWPVGVAALRGRDKMSLLWHAHVSLESVGIIANDLLASKLLAHLCGAKSTFVDVGAHIGSIIAAVRRHVPDTRIIAIEAMPEKCASLRSRFPNIRVHQCAAGESDAEMTFYVNTELSGYSSLVKPRESANHQVTCISVPVRRLDDLVSEDKVDVVKIDVEGAELGVIRGSSALIDRCRPIIMFESAPLETELQRKAAEGIYEFLDARKYVMLVPNRLAHDGRGLSLEGYLESHLYPRRTTNYFAVPSERREEFRDRARTVR
jgi:FkbM family methyltransferase